MKILCKWGRVHLLLLVPAVMTATIGCAAPIGVSKFGPEVSFRQVNLNILNSDHPSVATWDVLQRFDLAGRFDDAPSEVLAQLREQACHDRRSDLLFALAELSYAEATRTKERSYYLQSSIYAYLYLFGEQLADAPDPYDRRFRLAIDLYNRSLAQALSAGKGAEIVLGSRAMPLPLGQVNVKTTRFGFLADEERFPTFLSADNFKVRGITRYREPGLGIPLIAIPAAQPKMEFRDGQLPPALKIPATAFLRILGDACHVARGELSASLELYSIFDVQEISIGERKVPLEVDQTTPLAYTLEHSEVWEYEIAGFFGREKVKQAALLPVQPYQRGKIPVVFVHGTASSPARWSGMFNGLMSDPFIRQRFQFWMFLYPSGNPIAYSASLLRDSLTRIVKALDPKGEDPAMNRMVLIGHSQGGLLVKMMVIEPGDQFWRNISSKNIDDIEMPDETRNLLKKALFFHPLPFVKGAVFIATPQHGSFMSDNWIGRFFSKMVSLPGDIAKLPQTFLKNLGSDWPPEFRGHIPTSVENMSPENPFMRRLAAIPIAPGVHYHSIIAVKGEGDPKEGNDGVVAYSSAHIEGAESEYIVRSSHSVQANPLAIEEVRRILLEHAGQPAPAVISAPAQQAQ